MSSKINQILKKWPPGTVALLRWLNAHGISKDLARVHVKGGWISPIGSGAYLRSGDAVNWKGGVFALQQHAQKRIWPGGLTALSLQGYAHHLPIGSETVWLFGAPGERLPKWFKQHQWGQEMNFLAPDLFESSELDVSGGNFGAFSINISSPERAVVELLYQVPNTFSFAFAAEIVQGLVSLRPGLMQQFLESCRSIKAKRLLLFLAGFYQQQWLKHLDRRKINLGSGKRQIIEGGRLDSEYQITVPMEFAIGPQ